MCGLGTWVAVHTCMPMLAGTHILIRGGSGKPSLVRVTFSQDVNKVRYLEQELFRWKKQERC